MKIVKLKKRKAVERNFDGAWTEFRDKFVGLKPADLLNKLRGSVMRCPANIRPYLSRIAKMEGINYFTYGLPNGDMLVIRHKRRLVPKDDESEI